MPTRLRRFAQSPRSPIVRERPTMHGTPVCAPLRPGSPTLPATSLTFSATSRDPRLCFPCDPDERQLRHDEQRLRRDAYEVGARAHLQPGRGPVGRRAAYLRARSSKRRFRCRAHYAPCRRIRRRVPSRLSTSGHPLRRRVNIAFCVPFSRQHHARRHRRRGGSSSTSTRNFAVLADVLAYLRRPLGHLRRDHLRPSSTLATLPATSETCGVIRREGWAAIGHGGRG